MLFTNVPLENTFDVILKRIYDQLEVRTNINRAEMKELLLFCTRNVHFSFGRQIYVQVDGVAMGSPLGPVLANIFMVELERSILPEVAECMLPWKRYVDDTLSWIEENSVNHVVEKLESFHENIKFTYELEKESRISFLDVLLIRSADGPVESTVFRKKTDTDIYLNWKSFAPLKWKRGTLRTLLLRAYSNCSSNDYLDKEIAHLRHVFTEINGYPHWIFNQENLKILHERRSEEGPVRENILPNGNTNMETTLVVPYHGDKGEKLIKSLVKVIEKVENNHVTKIVYTSTKLSTCFNVKDKQAKEHEHDIVYKYKCEEEDCGATYIGETARRFSERIKDHCGRDSKSHVFMHHLETGHKAPAMEDFTIINKHKKLSSYFIRTIAESLTIKKEKPVLNCQEKSTPLQLFN